MSLKCERCKTKIIGDYGVVFKIDQQNIENNQKQDIWSKIKAKNLAIICSPCWSQFYRDKEKQATT